MGVRKVSLTPRLLSGMLIFAVTALTHANEKHGIEIPSNISLSNIPVCYDFGCKQRSVVNLPLNEWEGVTGWFEPIAASPAEERDQIKKAIGWMEVLIGRHTPTHRDLAFDLPPLDDASHLFPGQQDCIDEAVNTTTYLRLLEQYGLLSVAANNQQLLVNLVAPLLVEGAPFLLPVVAGALEVGPPAFYLAAAGFGGLEAALIVNDVEVPFVGLPAGAVAGLLLVPLTVASAGAGVALGSLKK